jgi:VIT1/CCC1 family predicted Fe2+/Mn2+ transporter
MSMATANDVERARRDGELFQSLLMGVATGMAAFFLTTFVAIISLLVYMMVTGKHPDFALTYRVAGFPVGVVVMALALGFLGVQWARRMKRKMRNT